MALGGAGARGGGRRWGRDGAGRLPVTEAVRFTPTVAVGNGIMRCGCDWDRTSGCGGAACGAEDESVVGLFWSITLACVKANSQKR